jgi:hypothetical protein
MVTTLLALLLSNAINNWDRPDDTMDCDNARARFLDVGHRETNRCHAANTRFSIIAIFGRRSLRSPDHVCLSFLQVLAFCFLFRHLPGIITPGFMMMTLHLGFSSLFFIGLGAFSDFAEVCFAFGYRR